MKNKIWYFFVLFLCISWLIYTYNLIVIPNDPGDGLMHFFIAQASWSQPHLLLDQWGKPLFILLSSPFAQFGYSGMFTFNLLVYIASCLIALRIFTKLKVNLFFAAFFPLLLLLANDFSIIIFAGLTECLFNLFVISAFLFLVEKKWIFFALIISLTPFLRSEGQLVLLLGLIVLLLHKEWKIIPYLFIFPLIYFSAGLFVYGDFWWYFTKSSYQFSNNIYGHGTWTHYFYKREDYLGKHGSKLIILAFCSLVILVFKRKWEQIRFSELFFASGIFLGIVLFHSYLWANGKYGSLGLTRITTQGMPLFFLISIYYSWLLFIKLNAKIIAFVSFCLIIFLGNERFKTTDFFTFQKPFEKQIMSAGNFLNKYKSKLKKIHYHHPLIAYQLEYNPFIDAAKIHFYYGHKLKQDLNSVILKGEILVWDSQFGPVEAGMPLSKIKAIQALSIISEFNYKNEKNKIQGAIVFQYANLKPVEEKLFSILKAKKIVYKEKLEFVNVYKAKKSLYQETYRFKIHSTEDIENYMVCTNEGNIHYQARKISQGENTLEFVLGANTSYDFYFWNPSKKKNELEILDFSKVEKIYPKLKF